MGLSVPENAAATTMAKSVTDSALSGAVTTFPVTTAAATGGARSRAAANPAVRRPSARSPSPTRRATPSDAPRTACTAATAALAGTGSTTPVSMRRDQEGPRRLNRG